MRLTRAVFKNHVQLWHRILQVDLYCRQDERFRLHLGTLFEIDKSTSF